MPKIVNGVLADIGLGSCSPFLKDRVFHLALFSAVVVWIILWFTVIPTFNDDHISALRLVTFIVFWYPLLEEILFRGIIQKYFSDKSWGSKSSSGLSIANWLTSLLFVLAHFWYQPVLWAMSVFIPSLVYGYFRDKYSSIYPCIILHSFYNAGFVGMNIIAQ